tara:strand:- start:679 stop:1209 length:531 start_codon:yes stop_codon:yes gene_type:complete
MSSNTRIVAKALSGEHDWVNAQQSSYNLSYTNRSSFGNRHVNWHGLWAEENLIGDKPTIDYVDAHDHIKEYDWRVVFACIEHGVYVGTATKQAIEDCVQLIQNTEIPEPGGETSRHVNWLGGVNRIDNHTAKTWQLRKDLKKIMLSGFQEDKKNKQLLSPDWHYYRRGFAGWSRSC